MPDEVNIPEFRPEDMPISCTLICIGPPGSGKSSFMENMAYYKKHIYPVGRVFIAEEDGYKKYCDIFPPLFVSNYWDELEERQHVKRQRTCKLENGPNCVSNFAINIVDDATDDTKVFNTPLFKSLFKIGSQHWDQLFMLGTQYAIDLPPEIRMSVSYVAIGREVEEGNRQKLYKNFGGIVGSYKRFCDLMDQIAGEFTFLVIKKRSQSNNLEDCVSFYQTKQLKKWKFGCKEYRQWHEDRYNQQYVEEIII